jgi:hypothetical protein
MSRREKSLGPARNQILAVQSLAHCYNDLALLALTNINISRKEKRYIKLCLIVALIHIQTKKRIIYI